MQKNKWQLEKMLTAFALTGFRFLVAYELLNFQ